jgi:endoglucanase
MATRGPKDRPDKVAIVRVRRPVPSGIAGMFDLGTSRATGKRFQSRAIDDLGGLAAALAMLDTLARRKTPCESTICLLCTRAEEEGFIGAIAAVTHAQLLKKTDRLIAIECSAMQPYAPQGKGVILRVGDFTSIFHSGLTYFIRQQAAALQERDKSFQYQRALMPGGTCEATVYDAWGYLAASLCVPLGNYHNMDVAKKKMAAEFIDLDDWNNMVKLFLQIARHGHEFQPGHRALKKRVEQRYELLKQYL